MPDQADGCPWENPGDQDADGDGCTDQIEDFAAVIEGLGLPSGVQDSSLSQVNNALDKLDKGNTQAAIKQLGAFIREVEALRGKKISEADADMLIEFAQNIIEQTS